MIRDAVTCDASDCLALYLGRGDMPQSTEFEHHIEAHGWVSRPAGQVLSDYPDALDVLGHLCPACSNGRGPVLELGECPRCMGRTVDLPDGSTCHYCRHVQPQPAHGAYQAPVPTATTTVHSAPSAPCET
ncbi:hypothetical protein M2164_000114 [Streptomyces sp. SAI-208]|nr:hypothetical protein [Streptomyces sp. SAI-208]